MSTVLAITSSALGDASVSNHLVEEALAHLRSRDPNVRIVMRDLGRRPIPHLDLDSAAALRGAEPANDAQARARSLSDDLIAELKAANVIVIGAPMYNFGMPSTLKSWFDYVLRAGITFSYDESGPKGLLNGKRAWVIESRGGFYREGPAQEMDAQEPHLKTLLNFVGITDVTFFRAERLALGSDARERSIDGVRQQLGAAIHDACRRAA